MKNLIIIFLVTFLISCNSDDDNSRQCLEEPCGTIVENSVNFTVFTDIQNFEALSLNSTTDVTEVNLSGLDVANQVFFSCWQVLTVTQVQDVSVTISGETFEIPNIENNSNSELISINITEQNNEIVVAIQDFTECEDVFDL
ncbi:hypothetical protein ACWGOQ_0004535 [Aquimarina sp. M1]